MPPELGELIDRCRRAAADTESRGNRPFAALAVSPDGSVIAEAVNLEGERGDVTQHAELRLLGLLFASGADLEGVWVVVNAEPCSMCSSALAKARVAGIAFGVPAEPGMDPWLPIAAVVAASRRPPEVVGPIGE